MTMSPLVSVLVTNYNYAAFLREAVDSALDQTHAPLEVVVVDDGSTDESPAIMRGYGNRIVAVLQPNRGQAAAFNAGFAASSGEIICLLDADDRFLPGKVSRVVEALNRGEPAASCFHALSPIDKHGVPLPPAGRRLEPGRHDHRSAMRRGRIPYIATATSGLCFRRSLLERILPLPEAAGVALSDNYLKFSALALEPTVFVDEPLAELRIHGGNIYTARDDAERLRARIRVVTGYWLRRRFPELRRSSDRLFAVGLGLYWRLGGVEPPYRQIVRDYLAESRAVERLAILLRAAYRRLR